VIPLARFESNTTVKRTLPLQTLTALAVLALLAGCSVLEEDKINYKSASKSSSLDVPPDLTQLRRDSRYMLESNSATASGFANAQTTVRESGTAANTLGPARLERSGNQRWLVVNLPAEKVWDRVREFWTSNGFVLATDAAELGIMETDWAENRAKIPQDLLRRTLGKVLDGLYSSGERDRYRTRIERNSSGGVDIYITHRGMVEEYADSSKTKTVWVPRAADPELEIEFMRRLMVKLGATPQQAQQAQAQQPASAPAAVLAQRVTLDGQPALTLAEPLDRAWRRTGLALDRGGFTVEDRDRSRGLFDVRYVAPSANQEEPGFFSRMFSSKPATATGPRRYQIQLSARGETTELRVRGQDGQAANADDVQNILQLLANQLR